MKAFTYRFLLTNKVGFHRVAKLMRYIIHRFVYELIGDLRPCVNVVERYNG